MHHINQPVLELQHMSERKCFSYALHKGGTVKCDMNIGQGQSMIGNLPIAYQNKFLEAKSEIAGYSIMPNNLIILNNIDLSRRETQNKQDDQN